MTGQHRGQLVGPLQSYGIDRPDAERAGMMMHEQGHRLRGACQAVGQPCQARIAHRATGRIFQMGVDQAQVDTGQPMIRLGKSTPPVRRESFEKQRPRIVVADGDAPGHGRPGDARLQLVVRRTLRGVRQVAGADHRIGIGEFVIDPGDETLEALAQATSANATRLFGLPA